MLDFIFGKLLVYGMIRPEESPSAAAETPLTPGGSASKAEYQAQGSKAVVTPISQRKQRNAKGARSTPDQSQATPKPAPNPKATPASRGNHSLLLFYRVICLMRHNAALQRALYL